MGVIRRQSIKTSLLSYAGVGLGYLNVILLFPSFLSAEEFGLTRVMLAVVTIGSQFALLGSGNSIIRFFPEFKDPDKGHRGLLRLGLILAAIGFTIICAILLVMKPWVIQHYAERSSLVGQYFMLIIPFLGVEVLFQVFRSYSRALLHSVVNIALKEVVVRSLTTILLVAFYFGLMSFDTFILLFVVQYGVITLALAVYLIGIGEFFKGLNRHAISPSLKKRMTNYSLFAILSNTSTLFVMNIDVMMINEMIGLEFVAFYAVAFYVVSLINIPRGAILNIAMPLVSEAWKNNNIKEIHSIYEKSSINQLTIGILFFVGIWANQETLFAMLPPEYARGKWVLFFVGIARLIDISFGINGGILANTSHYRYETYFGLGLVVISIILNLIFIPIWGITGAAIATGTSLLLLNLGRYFLLKSKLGIGPFGIKSMIAIMLGITAYAVNLLIPQMENIILDLVIRSAAITIVFVPLAIIFKLSVDGNQLLFGWWKKLTNRS
ncbi:MAG: O-antigen/teichoic acid export membrane protein [Granulosicoccus sp.]|jgi:O-antigen/teichoic acid export membrane protein